jgi:hypothetical protein
MHDIEPYYNWLKYYDASFDERSPFFEKEYNYDLFQEHIYGYYIHPAWDSIESETLYLKVLYADYQKGFIVLEFIGEWNDTLHNDVMLLKRTMAEGINKFILIGENLFNFHGSDDAYYDEWFDEVEEGWIAAVGFPEFIQEEMRKYKIDQFINMGGTLEMTNWRTLHPQRFYELVSALIQRRLGT